ncbi:MAG TPA: orotidine-5'-phosphate decarboxylase [Kiritimatiellia bacterium]|mgnify:CR=1 FL=1|nr:orotidine-5'-phosphate decarboxylase [Kiritimatiellia bacterium]HMP34950.1 orotidine-5'-phosphate decarboxylase [Kiritimatiellia bacterium]
MHTPVIVALDVPDRPSLAATVERLPPAISWYKVGLELFCAEGPGVLEPLQTLGKNIFLDLKLHDIPRTVERAVSAAARHRVHLLTLHAGGGKAMLEAAVQAARAGGHASTKLLAVTVLTSLDTSDLQAVGVARSPRDQAVALAVLAREAGVDGVVCSLHEASAIRAAVGPDALIVTPGIRLPSNTIGDQKRVGTPRDARDAGATHLVVGRPILEADDPAAAYAAIMADLAS